MYYFDRFSIASKSGLLRRVTAICLIIWSASLPLNLAQAGTYSIPMDKSVAEIDVPDSWNPNSSDLGVDAASPDSKMFFSIYAATDEDEKGALMRAASIASNGDVMQIDIDSVQEKTVKIGSIQTNEYSYNTTMNGKTGYLAINLAQLKTGGYLQIIRWGTRTSFRSNARGSTKIFKSLKLLGQ